MKPSAHTLSALCLAMGITVGVSTQASAQVITADWTGLFTMLDPGGVALQNTSKPYYYDATWGYGYRTQISGTLTFDMASGAGSATVQPVDLWGFAPHNVLSFYGFSMQAIGDGNGGNGSLVQASLFWDIGSANDIPVNLILDPAGFFGAGPYATSQVISGVGAIPGSDGILNGKFPIGPAPIVTTTYDSAFPLSGDGIGGIPMTSGPFVGLNVNFDFTALHITSVSPIPLPAAAWLFGSGLLGLLGLARTKRNKQS